MIMRLPTVKAHKKNHLIFLSHDGLHDTSQEHGASNLVQLREFLRLATIIGYEFKTIDTYLEDWLKRKEEMICKWKFFKV